jgi:hypothetical protein
VPLVHSSLVNMVTLNLGSRLNTGLMTSTPMLKMGFDCWSRVRILVSSIVMEVQPTTKSLKSVIYVHSICFRQCLYILYTVSESGKSLSIWRVWFLLLILCDPTIFLYVSVLLYNGTCIAYSSSRIPSVITVLPLHHLHTSMFACTENMYQFCFKLKSNDSIFTDVLIDNTSRYAFMYHYCYAFSSTFTSRIIHFMITTSWFHLLLFTAVYWNLK